MHGKLFPLWGSHNTPPKWSSVKIEEVEDNEDKDVEMHSQALLLLKLVPHSILLFRFQL